MWKIAIEFRNKSWYRENVYKLIDSYKAVIVTHDIRASAPPMIKSKADFVYIRFHGPSGNYRESYSNEFLSEYAEYISAALNKRKTVYVYFNNTMGDAFNNLVTLNNLIVKK